MKVEAQYSIRTIDAMGSLRWVYPEGTTNAWRAYRERCQQIPLGRLVYVELRAKERGELAVLAREGTPA